jgi:hypothetical protein
MVTALNVGKLARGGRRHAQQRMAVLIEAISVVVRMDAIRERYPGGWEAFRDAVPNRTLCCDDELARIGFMTPADAKSFVERLEASGLAYLTDGQAQDIVVVDQMCGPTMRCDWVGYGTIHLGRDGQSPVKVCRLKGSDVHVMFGPDGWAYEGSLSQTFGFAPTGAEGRSLRFLRHENGLDVYLNLLTGKEAFVGRTGGA